MLDFLFITSPTYANSVYPPFYFLYLTAFLEKNGEQKVKLVDVKGKNTYSQIRQALIDNPARFVGLSAFHPDFNVMRWMGEMVKSHQPATTLLVGNAHATIDPQDFIYLESPFDIAVLGEGELACLELAKMDKEIYSAIKGIAFYKPEKFDDFGRGCVKTGVRDFMGLAELPTPAYDHIDMDFYLRPTKLIIRRLYARVMPILTGRGCPFDCMFCASNVVWKANRGVCSRVRPVGNVIDEIDLLRDKYKADFVYLSDDMFGVNKKWMDRWFNRYGSYFEHYHFPYACQTRANIITEDMVIKLKESGCIQLDIGVESGDQKVLDLVNKKITLEQVRQSFEWCRKHRLRSFATMMVNMPHETKKSIRLSERLLKEIRPTAGVTFAVCTPYPGTAIYDSYVNPKLDCDGYSVLDGNNLVPDERLRMTAHTMNLDKLRKRLGRKFRAIPMFERMLTLDRRYWWAVFRSSRLLSYMWAWVKDVPRTFLTYWRYRW